MRRHYLFISLIGIISLLSSCKSNEEKATELIHEKLSKSLFDFKSYEPIETTVKEAYNTAYNDSMCFHLAMVIAYGQNESIKAYKEAQDATEYMNIWGEPTSYSSSYSDSQYYKYKKQRDSKLKEAINCLKVVKITGIELEDSIKNLDNKKVIGWEVCHRFRCKTKGGHQTIGEYRYIIDRDFSRIIFEEDVDDELFKSARKVIVDAEKEVFTELDLDMD